MRKMDIPVDHGEPVDTRSVAAVALDFEDGHWVASHSHHKAQLLYATQGVLVVGSAEGHWLVPGNRGLWIPPGVAHWTRMVGAVRIRTLYIDPALVAVPLPASCCVLGVSPLLRELILAAVDISGLPAPDSRDGRVMALMLDELSQQQVLALHLPQLHHRALQPLSQQILLGQGLELELNDWAAQLNVNPKTLQRWFLRDTGMTFGKWRQQARLLTALQRLALGRSVLEVALDVGYNTPSAFSAMFRRQFGVSPSEW
ncbi:MULTISPECIES: AraC family transcriptional regulator [unclassified Pseudomonas]|uniref:AraC family transcriptional regulator n=1 Tax=unclassified Pseudomonas TaxID=196821 RepID=UPI0005BD0149|nr:helix-turn-helix transcriptional regulator [Pseudomonas sp. M47T1]